jgi:hypothetical protein
MRIILLFFVLVGFISCEKDIELNLDKTPNQLVIDASIENGRPPVVILSKSLNYFNKINKFCKIIREIRSEYSELKNL